jgi:translation initiation factor 2 subunit 3
MWLLILARSIQTVKHSTELVRNITIKLGYANAKIYQCPSCPRPSCFGSHKSSMEDKPPCKNCGERMNLMRHVSFVDW